MTMLLLALALQTTPAPAEYRLMADDVLAVLLNGTYFSATVKADGTVSLPVLGDVPAAGEAVRDLTTAILAAYATRLPGTAATVNVLEMPSRRVLVIQPDGSRAWVDARTLKRKRF